MRSTCLTPALVLAALALAGCEVTQVLPALPALPALPGATGRTTTVDQLLTTHSIVNDAKPGSLLILIMRVRAPSRLEEDLPAESRGLLVPNHLRIWHPHTEKEEDENGTMVEIPFRPKLVEQFAPVLPTSPVDAGPQPPLYAILASEPRVFVVGKGDIALGWSGTGPRVWVRGCRHELAGRVDLVCEQDELEFENHQRACLDEAWFPGVDTIFFAGDESSINIGDPGREGYSLVIIRCVS
jgi:hypothetical protein